MDSKLDRRKAIAILWNKGILTFKLDKVQKELYQNYLESTHKTVVWSCSRRLGKSWTLCVVAVEQCLKKPNTIVKYVAPQQKMVKTIVRPILRDILKDCPKELRPEYKTNDHVYRFPNGSEIQIAGADSGHAESLRGGSAHLCIVDEAGFIDDLRDLVQSILIPTTTTTRGKIILSSTPPKSPGHAFCEYLKKAEFHGTLIKKTIYENPRLTAEQVKEIEDEYGVDSVEFRREFLCEQIVDENVSVVPEFTEALMKDVTKEWKAPPFRDCYVSGDIGFKDLTVFLFAYYDFKSAKLIIEDELVMSGKKMTTEALAANIKAKEAALWTQPMTHEFQPPYLRVCDNNLIVINDLQRLHHLNFIPTQKDDKEAALNNMRILLKEGRIVIHPRCKSLLFHLRNATWAKSRKTYERSPDAGHYDAVDALLYLVRNVVYSKNPYPTNYGRAGTADDWHTPEPTPTSTVKGPTLQAIQNIFKPRFGRK